MGRIFIINPKGELRNASVLVQSSTLSSLRAINELVGNIFPPLPAHVGVVLYPVIVHTIYEATDH